MVLLQVSFRSLSFVPHSLKVLHVLATADGVDHPLSARAPHTRCVRIVEQPHAVCTANTNDHSATCHGKGGA